MIWMLMKTILMVFADSPLLNTDAVFDGSEHDEEESQPDVDDLSDNHVAVEPWDEDFEWEKTKLKALSGTRFSRYAWLMKDTQGSTFSRISLRFFEWKVRANISDRSFDKLRALMLEEFEVEIADIRSTRRHLASELGIHTQEYHCCVDNCMAFTAPHELCRICRHCKEPRFYGDSGLGEDFTGERDYVDRTPRAIFRYLPLIPRLKVLYANKEYSKQMRYPKDLLGEPWEEGGGVRDVWEGEKIEELKRQGTHCPHRGTTG